jgi:hypothetical protein
LSGRRRLIYCRVTTVGVLTALVPPLGRVRMTWRNVPVGMVQGAYLGGDTDNARFRYVLCSMLNGQPRRPSDPETPQIIL